MYLLRTLRLADMIRHSSHFHKDGKMVHPKLLRSQQRKEINATLKSQLSNHKKRKKLKAIALKFRDLFGDNEHSLFIRS